MVFEELKVRFTGEDGLSGMLGKLTGGMGGATKGGLAMGAAFAVVQMAMQQVMKAISGLVKFIQGGIKAYLDFEKGLAEVATLLDDTSPLEGYATGLRNLAMASGESLTTLTKGLYQVISASVDAGAAMGVLTVANRAAVGGVSDTATAVDAITSIMNAYGLSAAAAESISDQLFTAVKYGKTTFGELAQAIGPVITMAANLGISFDQVAAAMATMTRSGIQTNKAVTYLRGIFTSVLKPTKMMKDTAKELGIVFDATSLKSMGLGGFLNYVADAAGDNSEALSRLFPNVRAIQGVMALAGENADGFANDLDHMAKSAGATTTAFEKMEETSAFKLALLRAEITDLQLEIGERMVPSVKMWEGLMLYLAQRVDILTGSLGALMDGMGWFKGRMIKGARVLFLMGEETKTLADEIDYTNEEITAFANNLDRTIKSIGDYDASIRKATSEIKVLTDSNVELLEKIEDLSRIKEITDDFKNLKLSTKDATYAQQIFDNELKTAQIELLNTKILISDLKEDMDEYGDITKKNNLEIMKIRYKAKKEGRELTKAEEDEIAKLELANEGLRIKIAEEAIKIDDIEETALREQEDRVAERVRQLEEEEQALEDKAQTEIEKLQEEIEANKATIATKLGQIAQFATDRKTAIDYLHDELLSKLETFDDAELAEIEIQSGRKLGDIEGFIDKSEEKWYNHYQYLKELWDTYPTPEDPDGGGGGGGAPPPPDVPTYHIATIEPMIGPLQHGDESKRPYYYTSTSGTRRTGLKGDYADGEEIPWKMGGYVSKLTRSLLHPGEYVLPKKVVDLLDFLVSRPPSASQIVSRERTLAPTEGSAGSGSSDTHIYLYGDLTFHGIQNVDSFMKELHRRSRIAGARRL